MNKELMVQDNLNFDLMLQDVDQMQNMCKKLMQSKHYQKMGEEGIFALIQKAKSLNMNPMEALNGGLYYVQGKVGMSTEAMNALIRKAGHSITKDAKSNNSICILHGRRADNGDTWTCSFSLEDAKRAGLLKNMFEKYPSIMLFNRCMSMLARQLFPDVIKGAGYTHDELVEIKECKPALHRSDVPMEFEEEKIAPNQVEELACMLSICDPDFVKKFEDFIKKPPVSANSLMEIPVSQYSRLHERLLKEYDSVLSRNKKEDSIVMDTSFSPEEFEKDAG